MRLLIRYFVLVVVPLAGVTAQTLDRSGDANAPEEPWQKIMDARDAGEEIEQTTLRQKFRQQYPDAPALSSPLGSEERHQTGNAMQTSSRSGWEPQRMGAATELHVIPPAYAVSGGTATFTGPLATTPRTYQLLIHDSLLTAVVGRKLAGLIWRIPGSASGPWPVSDVTYANFELHLSGSVPPANRSLTFTDNVVGPQTQVRSGSLIFADSSFPAGRTPNDWGPEITFTPWLYSGGHLLIELRHTGFTGTSRSVDAIGTSTSGYGSLFSGLWQSGTTPTTGLQGNFSVIRLTSVDSTVVSVGDKEMTAPAVFALSQNYPNPFNPSTTIGYELPVNAAVKLMVFDMVGREIATLVNEAQAAGRYEVQFDASQLTSGVYFYRLVAAGSAVVTRRMLLVK